MITTPPPPGLGGGHLQGPLQQCQLCHLPPKVSHCQIFHCLTMSWVDRSWSWATARTRASGFGTWPSAPVFTHSGLTLENLVSELFSPFLSKEGEWQVLGDCWPSHPQPLCCWPRCWHGHIQGLSQSNVNFNFIGTYCSWSESGQRTHWLATCCIMWRRNTCGSLTSQLTGVNSLANAAKLIDWNPRQRTKTS